MNSTGVLKLIPKRLKRPVKSFWLSVELGNAVRSIRKLSDHQMPSRELLAKLIKGWSNDGYAANLDYLESVARHAIAAEGPVLECGSGVTTILLGLLCQPRKTEVWSLEHSPEWSDRVDGVLKRNGILNVRVCDARLIDYGAFLWYDPPMRELPKEFSLVICDGPPGATRGGRYGLLPVMKDRLPPGAIILLDDADRPAEKEMIKRWESEDQFETRVIKAQGGCFAILQRR